MIRSLSSLCIAALLLACSDSSEPVDAAAPGASSGQAGASSGPSTAEEFAFEEPEGVVVQMPAYGAAADRNLVGYLAMPGEGIPPFPGVIVIHESSGLDENIEFLTRRLAGEGFMALAVDLYGGQTAANTREARQLMTAVMSDPVAVLDNIRQAYVYLDEAAFSPSIATFGLGFGGSWSLQAALEMPDALDAAIVFYGQIVEDEETLAGLEVPLLGLFGEADTTVPVPGVRQFRSRLSELGREAEIFIYTGVGRGFDNPDSSSFDAETAQDAWRRTIEFLNEHLSAAAG